MLGGGGGGFRSVLKYRGWLVIKPSLYTSTINKTVIVQCDKATPLRYILMCYQVDFDGCSEGLFTAIDVSCHPVKKNF